MLASMMYWKTATDTVILQVSTSIAETLLKRLQMFVMRSKLTLKNLSSDSVILGLGGQQISEVLLQWFPQMPATILENKTVMQVL